MYIYTYIRGLQFYTFLEFNKKQTDTDRYWQKRILNVCKSMIIISFLCICLKFAKSANNITKHFLTKFNMGFKRRRIWCWFHIRWRGLKNCSVTKLQAKNVKKEVKAKISKSVHKLAHNFLKAFLQSHFNQFEINIKFCVFFIPILNLIVKKIFWSY